MATKELTVARENSVSPLNAVSSDVERRRIRDYVEYGVAFSDDIKEQGRQGRIDYITESSKRIGVSLKRHRELAAWGNVESRQRVREMNARRKELKRELDELKG